LKSEVGMRPSTSSDETKWEIFDCGMKKPVFGVQHSVFGKRKV